jgi:hypothetical protein
MQRYRVVLLIIFTYLFFLHSASGWAASYLLNPKSYFRTTGQPNSYTEGFSNCEPQSQYHLVVTNGNSDGSQRLSSSAILLNGQEVLRSDELNQNVDRVVKPVAVQPENTLELRLASGPGGQMTVSIDCVANCLEVSITPISDTIATNQTLVRGEVHSASSEVGVTVNDLSALVHGQKWAYFVALDQGDNPITATATNRCKQTATATINVSANPISTSLLRLEARPLQGLAPLTVLLKAQTRIANPVYQWDFNGDGIPDSAGSDLSQASTTYNPDGLYYPSVTVIDPQGQAHTETTLVHVVTREKVDAILQSKWSGMKDALRQADVEQAVSFFAIDSRERYRGIFNAVQSQLSDIAAGMELIQLITLENGMAKYRIRRQESAGEITYYIYFVIDKDGIWRIRQF